LQPEQELNVYAVEQFGCAMRLEKNGVTRDKLCVAIDELWRDDEARKWAKVLQGWRGEVFGGTVWVNAELALAEGSGIMGMLF
jgi:hypothetical protein